MLVPWESMSRCANTDLSLFQRFLRLRRKMNMNATIMNTNTKTAGEAKFHADPGWRKMYLVGGLCLLFTGVIYLTNITIGRFLGPASAAADSAAA